MSFININNLYLKMYSSIWMDEGTKNGMEVFGESEGGVQFAFL